VTVESNIVRLETKKEGEILDITSRVEAIVERGTIKNGVVFLFVPGSTAALTTIEYEPGLLADLPNMLERVAPREGAYEHERRWHDGNGHSHVRASLIGPDLFVPFKEKKLMLETWQQIVFNQETDRSSSTPWENRRPRTPLFPLETIEAWFKRSSNDCFVVYHQ
jgi:secondary thiamine-phosphate synthase enzyme